MRTDKDYYQISVRVNNQKYTRLYHHLKQLEGSHAELILMLAEQAIKMGNLEKIHPREILNGACYASATNVSQTHVHDEGSASTSHPTHQSNNDDDLGESAVKFGVMK